MSKFKFDAIFIAAVFAPVILFLVIPMTITYFVNKKEFADDQKKREIEEINQAIPFKDVSDAKQQTLSGNMKIILGYGAYFVTVVPILVLLLGKIQYGPNIPYLIFLSATGIPWLVCFTQSLMRAEKQRIRSKATDISSKPPSVLFINGIAFVPFLLLYLIIKLLQFSNHFLR